MMPPRNVLFLENSRGLGGSTVSLCNLVAHLDRGSYRPFVVLSHQAQYDYFLHACESTRAVVIPCKRVLPLTAAIRKRLAHWKGRSWLVLRGLRSALALIDELFCTVPYVLRLRRFARVHAIQCIHQNNGCDLAAILLARSLRLPVVVYQRGDEWDSATVRFFARFVSRFVANSAATRNTLLRLRVDPARISIVYPPVDLSRFEPHAADDRQRQEFSVSAGQLCFGIVGALVPRKGHRVFLKAAARVLQAFPTARAVVIGEAAEPHGDYLAELRALVRTLGIEDRVVFTGFRPDVNEVMRILDVVVHSSVEPEPFGRVIIEAMAMKKPVIAAEAGGPLEIITHGENGLLVPPGDDEQLAAAIVRLLSDRALADRLAQEGFVTARTRFSVAAHVQTMQGLYSAVLEAHGRSVGPASAARSATP